MRIVKFLGLIQVDELDFVGLPDGTVILTDGFTLLDSMSAIEVSSLLPWSGYKLDVVADR